jgi:hypothetical protein
VSISININGQALHISIDLCMIGLLPALHVKA